MKKKFTLLFDKLWKQLSYYKRWISTSFLILAFIFIGIFLWRSWIQIAPYFDHVSFRYLVFAQCLISIATMLGIVNWYFVQRIYGIDLTWMESAWSHIASNIIRYIPGYAWQYLSKAYLSGANTTNRKNITVALITELVILILSGMSLLGFIAALIPSLVPWFPDDISWLVSLLSFLGIIIWLFFSFRFTDQVSRPHKRVILSTIGSTLSSLFGWIALSLATWCLVKTFSPALSSEFFFQVLFAFVISTIIGIMVVFVPGGLGVREATLAFFLKGILPSSMGIIVSIVLRIGIILVELISFLFIFGKFRYKFPGQNPK